MCICIYTCTWVCVYIYMQKHMLLREYVSFFTFFGVGFRACGSPVLGIQGLGFRVVLGFRNWGLGFDVFGLGFGIVDI